MYSYEGDFFFGVLTALAASAPSMLFGIATYVLSALAIYTISRRRGLKKPWLAWIPVVNCWLLGSLSDQYRYVVKGENKSKRKWLLILNILMFAFGAAFLVLAILVVGNGIGGTYYGNRGMMMDILGPAMAMLGLLLPLAGAGIAFCIIRYMALYDVFKSLDPDNCVLFLVLSILFSPTEPFFLFFNRNKDQGMPPRRQETAYTQSEPVQEPWESDNKDYL